MTAAAVDALLALAARVALAAVRLFPVALALPVLGGRAIPTASRVPIVLVLAVGAAPALLDAPAAPLPPLTVWLVAAVARELALGAALALVLAAPFFALDHAGRLLDAARGANAAEVIAPDTGARATPLGELMRWTFGVVFLAAGGLRAVVRVVASSLASLPPDPDGRRGWHLAPLGEAAARWTAEALAGGVALGSAALVALVAAELVLAVAARLSPPVAHAAVALPARALAPLAVLAVAAGAWTGAARDLAAGALRAADALAR